MSTLPTIKGINAERAVADLGGKIDVYRDMLGGYRRDILPKTELIREKVQLPDLKEFVILVHGIKSASRALGIDELGEEMYGLEMAGKSDDRAYISENLERVLSSYCEYDELLIIYDKRIEIETDEALGGDDIKKPLLKLKSALEDFESDIAEEIIGELGKFKMNDEQKKVYDALKAAMDGFDYFESIECVNKLMEVI